MAYEDLAQCGSDELVHMLVQSEEEVLLGNNQPAEKIIAIKAHLKVRGEWYCHHDESLEPLENCTKCGRFYLYVEQPDNE